MRHILTIMIALLLLQGVGAELIVNTYTNDFSAYSPYNEQLKLCACEAKTDRVIVDNTGDFLADFTVEVMTDYPGAVRILENGFALAPKRSKEVLVSIEDSCGITGTFAYDLIIRNSYGRTERIHRTIDVQRCQVGSLSVGSAGEVGLCQPFGFDVMVKNVGTYADNYRLEFGPYEGIVQASRSFWLEPGQAVEQRVNVTFDCRDHGQRTIPVLLSTERAGHITASGVDVSVRNDYDVSIELPAETDMCAKTMARIPVTITNTGPVKDEYRLTLSGPGRLDAPETITLGPDEASTTYIEIAPDAPGSAGFTLLVEDAYGGIRKERDLRVTAGNCYAAAAEIRTTPETPASELVACCGQRTLYAHLQNHGDATVTYALALDGPSFLVLEERTVRLAPGEAVNVPIEADLPCSDEQYDITFIATPADAPHLGVSAPFRLESRSTSACFMVQVDDDELCVRETDEVIPVIVKHTGIAGGTYTIGLDDDLFEVQEDEITLAPGEQRAIHLVPKTDLVAQEKGRYILQPTFTIQDTAEYTEHVGVQLKGKSFWRGIADWWSALPWSSVTACVWGVVLLGLIVLVFLLILILIYAGIFVPFPDGMLKGTISLLKTLVVIAALLLVIVLALMGGPRDDLRYERLAQGQNATVIEWYQGDRMVVDLAPYFADPDEDVLKYAASQPDDVRVSIEGSLMTLTPDAGFAGENTLVVTASDGKGGSVDSPLFLLRVIPQKRLGILGTLDLWCAHLLVLELITLCLLLFLILLTIKEQRPNRPSKNVLVVVKAPKARVKAVRSTKRKVRKKPTKGRKISTRSSRSLAVIPAQRTVIARPRTETRMVEGKSQAQTVNIAVGSPVAVPGARVEEIMLVASKTGNTVHTPYCMIARRIPKSKRIAFSRKQDALREGLVPCKGCRPF